MNQKALQAAAKERMASKKSGKYEGFAAVAKKTSPALAAYIGRKKYGKAGFAALAAKGKKS